MKFMKKIHDNLNESVLLIEKYWCAVKIIDNKILYSPLMKEYENIR